MPKRPVKTLSFTLEQWPTHFRLRALLSENGVVIAASSSNLTMMPERAETVDAAELLGLVDRLREDVRGYIDTNPLPWA